MPWSASCAGYGWQDCQIDFFFFFFSISVREARSKVSHYLQSVVLLLLCPSATSTRTGQAALKLKQDKQFQEIKLPSPWWVHSAAAIFKQNASWCQLDFSSPPPSPLLTRRVNVFGFLRCLWLMEHQKPIWAQCDAFLRTRVCQGHTNIINEQEADWRETERREKRPRK